MFETKNESCTSFEIICDLTRVSKTRICLYSAACVRIRLLWHCDFVVFAAVPVHCTFALSTTYLTGIVRVQESHRSCAKPPASV